VLGVVFDVPFRFTTMREVGADDQTAKERCHRNLVDHSHDKIENSWLALLVRYQQTFHSRPNENEYLESDIRTRAQVLFV
jgi:hypothetical protein